MPKFLVVVKRGTRFKSFTTIAGDEDAARVKGEELLASGDFSDFSDLRDWSFAEYILDPKQQEQVLVLDTRLAPVPEKVYTSQPKIRAEALKRGYEEPYGLEEVGELAIIILREQPDACDFTVSEWVEAILKEGHGMPDKIKRVLGSTDADKE